MWLRQIDDPVIDAMAVSVNHLLLLPGDFTGDQQTVVQLCTMRQKLCAAMDNAVNCSEISADHVELEAFCFPDLFAALIFFDDDQE